MFLSGEELYVSCWLGSLLECITTDEQAPQRNWSRGLLSRYTFLNFSANTTVWGVHLHPHDEGLSSPHLRRRNLPPPRRWRRIHHRRTPDEAVGIFMVTTRICLSHRHAGGGTTSTIALLVKTLHLLGHDEDSFIFTLAAMVFSIFLYTTRDVSPSH